MAKKKKRYGYKDGDENARFAPGGSAASEWEEEHRQSFTMGRTINSSGKRFNTDQDVENYKPIKTETYQSYMASKLAQAKANNPKSRVHITANDLSSYSNARAKLFNIDPTAELKSQSEFTSQYKSSVDKKARLNDMVQLAQGLDLGSTQDLVRKSYNDLGAVEGLANTRTNAEGLLKRVEEYRKLYGDSKELKVLEDRAKGIADYINANAKGGSAVSNQASKQWSAPFTKPVWDTTTQTKQDIENENKALSYTNIEEKYNKDKNLDFEGVSKITPQTQAEQEWKDDKQLALDPVKKYEQNKKEIDDIENGYKIPLGTQDGNKEDAKDKRIKELQDQNTQILATYGHDLLNNKNDTRLSEDEAWKFEGGFSYDGDNDTYTWDFGNGKAKYEREVSREEMKKELESRGYSAEEANVILDYAKERSNENDRITAYREGQLRRRTNGEGMNLVEDIVRTVAHPFISPALKATGISGEYSHYEELGREAEKERYYEGDDIGKAVYDFGETVGTIAGSSLYGGAGAVPFVTKATEDSYYNALDKGASEDEATQYAATTGVITGLIYGVGLKGFNKIIKASASGQTGIVNGLAKEIVSGKPTSSLGKAIIKNIGTSALKEGATFAAITTTSQVADTLNQAITLGKNSDFQKMVDKYMNEGMSEDEAWKQTVLDIGQQIGQGAVESFASGAIMGAGGALIGGARQAKTYNEMRDRAETLKGEYEKFTADTTSPYFDNVTDRAELESQYRQKAKELHPDVAEGNEEAFNQLVQDKQRIEGILTGERSNEARTAIDNWENFVNEARDILGLERVLTTKEREGFVSDYEDIKTKLLETKTEVEKSDADQEVKDEVINNIDNEIARVDTAVEATADIVVPEENAIGKSKSGKPIYIDEVNGTDVTFVDSEGKKVTDYELDDTPQTELMELAIDKDYNTDTTKSMIKGFELANTDNVEAYAKNYDVFYAAGKDSSIKNFKDALAKAPELTSALEIVGTDAAGKAFSEGKKQVSPLQQKGLTKLPKGKFTNDTGKTNAATEYAEMFAIFSGGDVVATESPEKFISSKVEPGSIRGVYIEPEGKIIVDTKYTSFIRALNHEFGHLTDNFAIDEAEAVSDACMKFARESLGIKGVDDAIKNLQETYEVNGQEISYTEAQNEFIKNIIGTAMASPEGIEGLVGEFAKDEKISDAKKQNVISKFIEWIKNLIAKLKVYAKEGGTYEDTEFVLGNKEQRQDIINKQIDALKASRKILEEMSAELEGTTDTSEKFSLTKEQKELSKEYNNAVRNNDMDKAAEIVEQYAKSKGYTERVYHGTKDFGFTQIDLDKSDDKQTFWATDSLETAGTYSDRETVRQVSESYKKEDLEKLSNRQLDKLLFTPDSKFEIIQSNNVKKRNQILDNSFNKLFKHAKEYKKEDNNRIKEVKKLYNNWKNSNNINAVKKYFKDNPYGLMSEGWYDVSIPDKSYDNLVYKVNQLFNEGYNNKLFYDNEYDVIYNYDKENIIKRLVEEYQPYGNYEFYSNTDNFLTVDAKGNTWSKVPYNGGSYKSREIAEDAKLRGYDGVLVKNVKDHGGALKDEISPANVYIFFNPTEQVKSADPVTYDDNGNVIPLAERFSKDHDDIRYSVDENKGELVSAVDSEGNKLSKEQQDYFKDSKVRDEEGRLQVVYHGTVSDFTVFDRQYAEATGDWGKGFYFSDDLYDVNDNYATEEGIDLTNKIERRAEELEYSEEYENLSEDERYEIAKKEYIRGEAHHLETYLNIKEPVYIRDNNPTLLLSDPSEYTDIDIDREDYETEDEYDEAYWEAVDSGLYMLVDDIKSSLINKVDLSYESADKVVGILMDGVWDGGITLTDLKDNIGNEYIETENGDYIAGEICRVIAEELDYDGIIDSTVSEKFKGMGITPGTTHYIIFNSNQAKNVDNKAPTENEDIRYSIDNQDEELEIDTREKELKDANKILSDTMLELRDKRLNFDSANKIARDMKKNFNIDLSKATIKGELSKVTDAIQSAKGNINSPKVQDAARDFIKNMMRYSKGEIDDYNQSILDNIKKTPILLSDDLKSEIQDYGYWFRLNQGKIMIRNNGIPLDRQWVEWSDMYPAIFDATISDKDQPYELEKIINTLSEGIPFDDRPEAMEAYKTDLLLKIAKQLDVNNRNLTKAYNRVARLLNNDYKKRVREALREQRDYHNAEIAEMKLNEKLRGREQRIRKETTKVRRDNIKLASKLKRAMTSPTTKNRVPFVLQEPLINFLKVIDAGEQKKIEYYNKQIGKLQDQLKYATGSQYDEILNQIDELKAKKGEVDMESAFIALERDYKKAADELEANGELSQPLLDSLENITGKRGFSETAVKGMSQAAENFGGRTIYDLYLPEQKELNRVLKMLQTEIKNYNKIIDASIIGDNGQSLHISQVVQEGAKQIRLRDSELAGSDNKAKRVVGKVINKKLDFSTKNLRPDVLFNKLFGYHKNNLGQQISEMLEQGNIDMLNTKMAAINELNKMFETKEDRKHAADIQKYDSKHLYNIGIPNADGKEIRLPKSMIIQIKLHLNNERNRAHLIGGGLTIPNFEKYIKTGKGLDSMQQIIKGTDARVNAINKKIANELNKETPDFEKIKSWDMDIEQILSEGEAFAKKLEANIDKLFNDWDKRYIETHYKIFDGILKEKLNEKTKLRFGTDLAQEEKYTRLISDPAYLNAMADGAVGIELNQEEAGFMKQRTGARNPIILESCLSADLSQIEKSAKYVGFLIPQHNLNRILKFTSDTEGGDKINLTKVIQQNYPSALDYIDDFKKSVFGGKARPQHNKAVNAVMSIRAIEGLVANVNVELLQSASYPLAASEISYSSLLKGLMFGGKNKHPFSRADRELIDSKTPYLWARAADSMTEVQAAMNNSTAIGNLYAKLANNKYGAYLVGRISKIDNATVGRLWYAAEFEVQKNNPRLKKGSEEYYKEVSKIFNKATITTQPMYDALHRNEYQRSNNAIVKMLEMFKTVLVQSYNTVYDKQSKYNQFYKDYKNGEYNTTKEDVKKARKERNRAVVSWLVSMSLVAGIRAVIYSTLYHQAQDSIRDENGDITIDRVLKYYADSLLNSFSGAFLLGSDLTEAFEKATDKIAGYDNKYHNKFSLAIVDIAQDALDIIGNSPDLFDEKKRDKYLHDTFNSLVRTTGMPYKNTKRLVDGIIGIVGDFADNGEFDYSNELEGSQKLRKWAKGELEQEQVKDSMTTLKVGNAVKTVYLDKDITKEQAIEKLEASGLFKGTSNRSLSSVLEGKVEKWDIDSYKDEYLSTLTSGGAETAESRAVIQKITNLPYSNAFYSDSSKSHYKNYVSPHDKLIEHIKSWNPAYKKKKKSEQ